MLVSQILTRPRIFYNTSLTSLTFVIYVMPNLVVSVLPLVTASSLRWTASLRSPPQCRFCRL
jgi:hypothetical protein